MRRILLLAALLAGTAQAAQPLTIDVHRDVNCGCCKDWIKHLQANGFTVNDHVEADMSAVKTRLGVPYTMGSCHTGVIDGKFVEGHVPASEVLKLRERADLVGAAVPGMPMGSPGMEMGGRYDAYQVLGLGKDGKAVVLADYPGR
ncbi:MULTISPECIES: DUF411 domain-containing protein [unclassified Pseudomonas]|uniref:DUF411 domain-containing protein n=1 Tax=unclassified Pseudomonas TaxID=196821 RepID=UPI0002A43094|nr:MULTISPECIES: DUF411 domain-containing protein [unclassified Pseudomonas]MBB1605887.1 metal-binding protein [Pseudomonas sp. UMC76]MBB1639066.1 metal-binding protein [Pseudomonas sp. UME83]NTX90211.1 DUF411 domain-containing protein [Pseudomonas sp. UMA643]NTY22744.1 DUF411 domain-containing protein [Pseudomonas sp. UMC3103]NTY25067.1 DUF411 domain-containing protein [Pseudomonas sp. UMA603]